MMQNQGMTMQTPPTAITTKDLSYIKDVLSWELLACKKFHHLSTQVQNQEFKQELDRVGRMHQTHYQKILSHLQINNNDALSNIPSPQQLQ